jgi:predicted DCC family thiol-disulfide oxidoreductase YuxK
MFQKFATTQHPPTETPLLVWDGECGFCKYWVTRWRHLTQGKIHFKTYQEVAEHFPDIPLKEFKKASRLIEPNGSVYSGPDSAYRSYTYARNSWPWHQWYHKYPWFQWVSDHGYNHIAKHRPFYFWLTNTCFGNNPARLKPYWILYIMGILGVFYGIALIL